MVVDFGAKLLHQQEQHGLEPEHDPDKSCSPSQTRLFAKFTVELASKRTDAAWM